VLAIDLGATWVRAALVEPDGTIGNRIKERTVTGPRHEPGADRLGLLVRDALDSQSVARAVIGVPARVNYAAGALEQANNLPAHWPSTLSESQLGDVLGMPVDLALDADLASVGEAFLGAVRDAGETAFPTISSGVGAGPVSRWRLHTGTRKLVEVGNFIVDRAALPCGEPFSVDELGSGRAFERLVAEAALSVAAHEVPALAPAGDPIAAPIWNGVIEVGAIAAVDLVHCYTPEVLVVDETVGLADEALLELIRRPRITHGPRGGAPIAEVPPAALGDDAALVGAAAWAQAIGATA
jgi:predicted NBD/HSP70 family sugar kinase